MKAKTAVASLLALLVLAHAAPGSAHPRDPRQHTTLGRSVIVGAALLVSDYTVHGLFEYYAQTGGAVIAERGESGPSNPPTAVTGPWVAALYYPFYGSNDVVTFVSRPEDKVKVDLATGADVRFRLPSLGNVRLRLRPSSETPRTNQVAFTTPGGHHGHSWAVFGTVIQGKKAYVSGTVTARGVRMRIVELRLPGAVMNWIAEGGNFLIETN